MWIVSMTLAICVINNPQKRPPMRKSSLILAFIFSFLAAWCCINESRVLLSGETVDFHSTGRVPHGHDFEENKEEYEEDLKELDSLWRVNGKLDDYSDYGVRLVYLGRYNEAKAVFGHIEKLQPGRYATAANSGTVYELLGQNDSALYWIKRAVQIDPTSHYGSEWLHVKILEAKIEGNEKAIPLI